LNLECRAVIIFAAAMFNFLWKALVMTSSAYIASRQGVNGDLPVSSHQRGAFPADLLGMDKKAEFAIKQFHDKTDPLEKYTFLHTLQDTDENLFFKILNDNVKDVMPYVYTPTVGAACQNWGKLYRHAPRGLYFNSHDAGSVEEILRNSHYKNIKVIVFTDGERILGLGDLGINGMGIPIGKLALYTACGGIDPAACLPVHIDVGTNRESLHTDPYYFGLKQKRDRSENYYQLVEEFIQSAQKVYGREVLIQFEDFGQDNAFKLLDLHMDKATTFNDDLQGTAGVTLAGFLSSLKKCDKETMADHTIMFHGAGGAGIGIAELLCTAMMAQTGCSREDARKRIWLVDSKGLVTSARPAKDIKKPFAHETDLDDGTGDALPLLEAIKKIKPTALVGVSGQGGAFTEEVVREMAANNANPLIMALSNPTANAECTSEQVYTWSDGRAVYASGSPMPPVTLPDGRHFEPGQGNNAFVFPGVGLGALACGAMKITNEDFYIAALALSETVTAERLDQGGVYPPIDSIRDVSLVIAAKVAEAIVARGDSTIALKSGQTWTEVCKGMQYHPNDIVRGVDFDEL
jgi:malate dehydrogenase (oxaloacetate-decarboxylating)(NADP+)